MANRFTTSQWVPFRQEVGFAFFSNPHNLPKLMPAASDTRIDQLHIVPPHPDAASVAAHDSIVAGIGSEIQVSFRPVPWLPLRAGWLARITEFSWGSHFCDEQVRGPFAHFRHCHRTSAQMLSGVMGTLVSDQIDYALPFGPLGRMGSGLVRSQLEKTFAERQQRLVQLIAGT